MNIDIITLVDVRSTAYTMGIGKNSVAYVTLHCETSPKRQAHVAAALCPGSVTCMLLQRYK